MSSQIPRGDPSSDIEIWAGALGALDKCVCGTPLVDEGAFADALIKHYRLRGTKAERERKRIIAVVVRSGVRRAPDCAVAVRIS